MRHLLTIFLLLAVTTVTAAPLDAGRRKRPKKTVPATVATPVAKPIKVVKAKPVEVIPVDEQAVEQQRIDALNHKLSAPQIDSLVALWQETQTLSSYNNFFDSYIRLDSIAPDNTPDSIYISRLQALASPIHLPYNSVVKRYINRYTDTRYGTINRILGMSQYYFPFIEDELIREGLPVELRALPIIESALSATAVSPAGATGLWQFMPSTGKSYGLEVNSLVDQRRDPLLATRAACRFLKDLYTIYNDWTLAIAAYNCGPGNVNKALARAGANCHTYWDIYDYLPTETRNYIPAFIGASYAYAYHKQHNIAFTEPPLPLSTDTIQVTRLMHFEQIASTIGVPMETLRQLNPQYKLDIIPATTKSYTLILPQREISNYITNQEQIFNKDSMYLKEYINPTNLNTKRQEATIANTIYYKVKRGDTLGAIARRNKVTTTQLMRWNRIKNGHSIHPGQRLRIQKG
ncbi:MAG: transglycosylase SLT domain-containing protein [Alistipes sp.]